MILGYQAYQNTIFLPSDSDKKNLELLAIQRASYKVTDHNEVNFDYEKNTPATFYSATRLQFESSNRQVKNYSKNYFSLGWRPTLHAFGDPDTGLNSSVNLELFGFKFSADSDTKNRVYLERLDILNLARLTPVNIFDENSWTTNLKYVNSDRINFEYFNGLNIDFSYGRSYEFNSTTLTYLWAMGYSSGQIEIDSEAKSELWETGPKFYVRSDLSKNSKILATLNFHWLTAQKKTASSVEFQYRYHMNQKIDIGLSTLVNDFDRQFGFSIYHFVN